MMSEVPVRVLTPAEMHARNAAVRAADPSVSRCDFELSDIAATGEAVFAWWPEERRFTWVCPGCGHPWGGVLGDEPVSGWDAPRWVNSGTGDRPTLTPSLGCPEWRYGRCPGHWWLRDGRLVLVA